MLHSVNIRRNGENLERLHVLFQNGDQTSALFKLPKLVTLLCWVLKVVSYVKNNNSVDGICFQMKLAESLQFY